MKPSYSNRDSHSNEPGLNEPGAKKPESNQPGPNNPASSETTPNDIERERAAASDALKAAIIQEIYDRGPMPFERFMQLALYDSQYGYYQSGHVAIGPQGDFVTAPEMSSLFGQGLANAIIPVIQSYPQGDILEFGAGTGKLAVDILRYLESQDALPVHYYILELSGALRQRQQENMRAELPHLRDHVVWLDQLPDEPIKGAVIANEVLDAMPVVLFNQTEVGIYERHVVVEGKAFGWQDLEIRQRWHEQQIQSLGLEPPYLSELNPYLDGWFRSLSQSLAAGAVFVIDYGYESRVYYHPDRSTGTLMCHYQQQSHTDPLVWPGCQDITAHVDFSAVAQAALSAGFELDGYTTQSAFLIGCDILDLVAKLENEVDQLAAAQQLKFLLFPTEMGELFKVIGLTKQMEVPLMGFQKQNRREVLLHDETTNNH